MWIALEIKWFTLTRIPYQFYWSTVYKAFFTEVLSLHFSKNCDKYYSEDNALRDKQVDGKNKAVEETNSF